MILVFSGMTCPAYMTLGREEGVAAAKLEAKRPQNCALERILCCSSAIWRCKKIVVRGISACLAPSYLLCFLQENKI